MVSNQVGHIDWIDGAKGIAILCVILLHSIPCLREVGWMWHIGQAVPVFLFITAYLISVRMESIKAYFTFNRFAKMIKKVFVPFVIVLAFQLICLALIGKLPSLKTILKGGGIGLCMVIFANMVSHSVRSMVGTQSSGLDILFNHAGRLCYV